MDFALKNIQAKHVIENVAKMLKNTFMELKSQCNSAVSILFRLVPKSKDGKKYIALINPQAKKVQLAPCQSPQRAIVKKSDSGTFRLRRTIGI